MLKSIVVVGGGVAGARTATSLRAAGFDGRIALISAESVPPYDRPPLSKEALVGAGVDSTLPIDYADEQIELLLGLRAESVEPGVVRFDDGSGVAFDKLVLACGSEPIRPAGIAGAVGAPVLRTSRDAQAVRSALYTGSSLIIVGAGWIGAEVATAARSLGCEVTVVEQAGAPLSGPLGIEVGRRITPWYQQAGVRLICGARVVALDHARSGPEPASVEFSDGRTLRADMALLAVGAVPATSWLRELDLFAGTPHIVVDGSCRTQIPDIYAVGDCASWDSVRFGRRLHVEHWEHAWESPVAAASALLGRPAAYDPTPAFWSHQFGHNVQYAGAHQPADDIVWRSDESGERWSALWLRDGRLTGLLSVDRPDDSAFGRRALDSGHALDVEVLADASVPARQAFSVPPARVGRAAQM